MPQVEPQLARQASLDCHMYNNVTTYSVRCTRQANLSIFQFEHYTHQQNMSIYFHVFIPGSSNLTIWKPGNIEKIAVFNQVFLPYIVRFLMFPQVAGLLLLCSQECFQKKAKSCQVVMFLMFSACFLCFLCCGNTKNIH